MADLSSGLVGSMGSLLGGGAESGLAGGCAGGPMGGSSAASYNGGAAHDGASMRLGALRADGRAKQMEELARGDSTREEVDARVKECGEQMTQHKKLSAQLNALEAAHEARRRQRRRRWRCSRCAVVGGRRRRLERAAPTQRPRRRSGQRRRLVRGAEGVHRGAGDAAVGGEAARRQAQRRGQQQELPQRQQRLHEQQQEAAEAAVARRRAKRRRVAARGACGPQPLAMAAERVWRRRGRVAAMAGRQRHTSRSSSRAAAAPRWRPSAADAAAGGLGGGGGGGGGGAAGAVSELREEQRVIAEWLSGAAAKLDTLEETSASQAAALSEARAQLQAVGGRAEAMDELLGANDLAGMRHRVAMLQKHVESQLSLMSELRGEVGAAQRSADGLTGELRERLPQIKAEVDDVASARLPGLQRQLLTIGDSINAMWEVINGIVLQRDQDGYGGGGSGGGGGGGYPHFGSVAEEDEGRGGGGEVYFP